jgi:TolB-like protein
MTDSSLWNELRRRHVIRAAIAHGVVFWLLVQVAEVVLPTIGIIDDPVRWTVIAGIALFPVTITIAWFVEHPWHQYTSRRIVVDVMIIGVIAIAAGTWVWRHIPEGTFQRTSIVVLPFSIQAEDSVGQTVSRALAYEIISLLMKSRSIDVIGYESATSPVLAGLSNAEISSRLNVKHILAGTVRLNGDQMQIRARLEDALGKVLWRGDLDEDLDQLFKAEEELAAGVAKILGSGDDVISIETIAAQRCEMPTDPDALERYYSARHFLELRGGNLDKHLESIALFEGLIEEYPEFAEAMSGLAWAYWTQPAYDRETSFEENMPKALVLAEKAYTICDRLGEAMVMLPNEFDHENNWISGSQQMLAAIAMQPDKNEMYNKYTRLLRETGRLQEARRVARHVYEMNPLSVRSIKIYAVVLQYMETPEDLDKAEAMYDLQTELGSKTPNFARWHREQIACRDDLDCLLSEDMLDPGFSAYVDELRIAYRVPENEQQAAESLAAARAVLETTRHINWFNSSACWFDHLTPLFFDAWDAVEHETDWYMPNVWMPICGNVWATDEFKVWADERGLVEYWRALGWPDYCRPTGDSFVCEEPDVG